MTLFGLSLSRWNTILKNRICHRMLKLQPDTAARRRPFCTNALLEVLAALAAPCSRSLGAQVGVAVFLLIKVGGRRRQCKQD